MSAGAGCVYCKKPADGSRHDAYGELMLRREDLIVCEECDDESRHEPGPWNEWGD